MGKTTPAAGKKRTCKCGKTFLYSGKGRPFSKCPKCRKEK